MELLRLRCGGKIDVSEEFAYGDNHQGTTAVSHTCCPRASLTLGLPSHTWSEFCFSWVIHAYLYPMQLQVLK